MGSQIVFVGTVSYSLDPALGTAVLKADELDNTGDANSGAIRLELWLTTGPWSQSGTGYKIALDALSGSSNGVLGPHQHFANIAQTVPLLKRPPPGTYIVTLAAAEYSGADPTVDNGYVIDSVQSFPEYLIVDADGSLHKSSAPLPTIRVATQSLLEGDTGTHDMSFTLTLSAPSALPVSVQFDTHGETAVAGVDYQPVVRRTVTFAPGATTATVNVAVIGNTSVESNRAFEVSLSNPVGATVAPNDAASTSHSTALPDAFGLIVDDEALPRYASPTDQYVGFEWYLYAVRAELAWQHATGKGIKVGVFDQGIDASHPDLRANDLTALGLNSTNATPGGIPLLSGDNHGTMVAGVIAAARDGQGMVGVAYDAQLVSIYSPLTSALQYSAEIVNAFRYAASTVDVLNNSWGFGNLLKADTNWAFLDDARSASFAPAFAALHDLAANGRNGLGTVVVQSAGNAYHYGDDTNLHNFQNSRYIITVGATDYFGQSSYFSTTGASILVSAPGGAGNSDFSSILTTDRVGSAGMSAGGIAFADGTSFSSPIVAGVVALMLEANPHLGYRDVQQILAYTAHQTDIGIGSWKANGAHDWNGGGLRYNAVAQSSGFGQVDALAAVRLAGSWDSTPKTVANTVDVVASKPVQLAIPDNSTKGVNSSIDIASTMVVERVDVTVNITHPFIGDLQVTLLSPSGTVSYLMYRPSQGSLSAVGSSQSDVHFTFDTVLDWGESAVGTWTLSVRDLKAGDAGTFSDWTIDLIGHNASKDDTYIFTNEFPQLVAADPSRGVLSDTNGGINTINASALGSDDRIDLSGLTQSIINDGKFSIASGSTIQNAFGGDGDDVLIANPVGSTLRGMAGDDTLTGGAGMDMLDGGAGNDQINGGAGTDTAVYHGARALYNVTKDATGWNVSDKSGLDGSDHLTQVERLQFSDTTLALDIGGNAGQAYRVYQAAFNRAPDQPGLGFWIKYMDGGLSLNDVAAGFMASPEFKALYGAAPSHADLVSKLYMNVLHRPGEASGVEFWLHALDNPAISPASVLAAFAESAENQAALIGVIGNGFSYIPFSG